jgi:hypothetical protein
MGAKRVSYRAVMDVMNAGNVPTAHGGAQWHASTVQKGAETRR